MTDKRGVIVSDRMKGKLESDIIRNIDKICSELKSSKELYKWISYGCSS